MSVRRQFIVSFRLIKRSDSIAEHRQCHKVLLNPNFDIHNSYHDVLYEVNEDLNEKQATQSRAAQHFSQVLLI